MSLALSLAERGRGFTSPNPVVGAVVVKDGQVVGTGYHERHGGRHAEVNALAEAGRLARGATLYVTLEPCCVWGNTPPCTEAIIEAGVATVVVPMEDPNPEISGRGIDALRANGIVVRTGALRDEAEAQNAGYLKVRQMGLPSVMLKLAMSLDGRVAAPVGGPRWVSSSRSRARVHAMRGEADCVAIGIGTALADDPLLTDRRERAPKRQPARLVFDSRLRLPPTSKLAKTAAEAATIVACGEHADAGRREALEALGVSVWQVRGGAGGLDVEAVLARLASEGRLSVLCEGGPRLASSLLEAGLLDRVAFFIAPVLYGDGGVAAFRELGARWHERDVFDEASWSDVGGDLLFEARVSGTKRGQTLLSDALRSAG